jgi:hypothetical protein
MGQRTSTASDRNSHQVEGKTCHSLQRFLHVDVCLYLHISGIGGFDTKAERRLSISPRIEQGIPYKGRASILNIPGDERRLSANRGEEPRHALTPSPYAVT